MIRVTYPSFPFFRYITFSLKTIYLILFFSLLSCLNYSVTKNQTNPPVLISLSNLSTGGHLLVYRGNTSDLFFAGYKLYTGSTASNARNPSSLSSGIDCINRSLLPNLPREYSIEIYTSDGLSQIVEGDNSNRVCKFKTLLNSGEYISLRTLQLSFQLGSQGFQYSAPSNALIVP
jgi:hypothetical protein